MDLKLEYQSKAEQPVGMLGGGWRHSYEWFLFTEADRATLYTGVGEKYIFEKTEAGYLSPDSNNWTLQTNAAGATVTLPGGGLYEFNTSGYLTKIQDAWNNQIVCSYDANGCMESAVHSNGRRMDFCNQWQTAANEWRISTISVPDGASLNFTYNGSGLFTQVVEQVGGQSFTSYYQYGQCFLTNKVNSAGREYSFDYERDGNGGLTGKGTGLSVDGYYEHSVSYVSSNVTDVAYSARGLKQRWRYSYSDSGQLEAMYGPSAEIPDGTSGTSYDYEGDDLVSEVLFNGTGETWATYKQYDSRHNITNLAVAYCTTAPVQIAATEYDSVWKLPFAIVNAEGYRIEIGYSNGLPSKVKRFWSDTQSYDTGYGYNTGGRLVAITNANGHVTGFTYDSSGNLSTAFAEAGPVVSNGYNSLGFVTRTEMLTESGASSGRITQYERDAKGNVLKTTYADGLTSSNSYNALDYLTNTVDRAGRVTELTYAPTKKLTSVTRYLAENGSNTPVRMAYDYDQQFNTLRITEPRGRYVESYRLDIQDRITAVTNIEGQTMTVDYGVGNFVKKITRFDGFTVSNVYDVAGRNSSVVYRSPSGQHLSTISRSYYADGQPKTVSDGTSTISNTYDRLNRLVGSSSIMGSLYSAVTNAYDPVGNITSSEAYLGGSRSVAGAYRYDAAERLTNIIVAAGVTQSFAYAYSPVNGRIATVTNAQSGITTTYAYDLMDRTTNISYLTASGTLIRSLDYQYDALGMITNRVISGGMGSVETAYRYDTINRLINETVGNDSIDYQYDLAGNRTAVINNGGTNTYTLGVGDRLAGVTGTSGSMGFSYDAAGNTTNIITGSGAKTLVWNEKYQLISVTSAASFVSYSYDVLGRRTGRTNGTTAERYIYNGNQVAADLSTNGTLLRTYVWGLGIDNLLSMTIHGATATNTYYTLKDQQNSVLVLTDASGNVVESYAYDAYGRTKIFDSNGSELTQSAVGIRYLWQGREYDTTTGLYFFRARWYSPETGRWLSKDPVGIFGGANFYVFCGNNSVNFIDPSGLQQDLSGDVNGGDSYTFDPFAQVPAGTFDLDAKNAGDIPASSLPPDWVPDPQNPPFPLSETGFPGVGDAAIGGLFSGVGSLALSSAGNLAISDHIRNSIIPGKSDLALSLWDRFLERWKCRGRE